MKKPKNQKRLMSFLTIFFVLILITFYGPGIVAKAAGPQESINALTDILFGIIRAIGVILLGFGIVQIGISMKSQDATQRSHGFLSLAGGLVITFTKEIINLIAPGM